MKLNKLLSVIKIKSNLNIDIQRIEFDLKIKKENTLYIVFKKEHLFEYKNKIILAPFKHENVIYVPQLEKKLNALLIKFYDLDLSYFHFIAITGSEMKSSLAKLIFDVHNKLHLKSLLISTSFKGKNIVHSSLTTPKQSDFIDVLIKAKNKHIKYIIYEASSIGIRKHRLELINPNVIFLTNLKVDHLSYHHSLKNYYNAKKSYLIKANNIIAKDEDVKKININNYIRINNYSILDNTLEYDNQTFKFAFLNSKQIEIIPFIIEYLKFLKCKNINDVIFDLKYPSSRLEILSYKPLIMIDYAHSEYAFLNVSKYFSFLCKGKKIVVFSSGGNRDKAKRKKYGEYAKKYFDIRIVTEDNSRSENVDLIIKDIIDGDKNSFIVNKIRRSALKLAFSYITSLDDGILFLGKGNEDYIIRNNKTIKYNERKEIIKYLKLNYDHY